MNYKELKKLIKDEHLEEFNNLLPEQAKIKSPTEYISPERQMFIEENVDIAVRKIAEKYGYEIDGEFIEDEEDNY